MSNLVISLIIWLFFVVLATWVARKVRSPAGAALSALVATGLSSLLIVAYLVASRFALTMNIRGYGVFGPVSATSTDLELNHHLTLLVVGLSLIATVLVPVRVYRHKARLEQ